jgi:hypothetical protein
MTERRIRQVVMLCVVAALLAAGRPVAAQASGAPPPRKTSTARKIGWTVLGAAAGFGAGAWFGLHKFDDAVNSDRKVWTSAIAGAIAGGVAGGFLSRDIRRSQKVPRYRLARPEDATVVLPPIPHLDRSGDRALRASIRALSTLTPH